MSTITAILEPDPAGCLHLPVPPEMRGGKVRVTASLEPAVAEEGLQGARLIAGEFGRRVLVAPEGAPPMTSDSVKRILTEEE